jgi:cytochrome c oxidase subunit 1
MGWGGMNLTATVGAFMIALSVLLFIVNVLRSRKHGEVAGPNPWGAGTLEWSVASPPPMGNFPLVPVVHGRYPLWQEAVAPYHVTGLTNEYREVLITSVADAQLDHRLWLPSSTPWPFLAAVATTILFIGSIFTPWAVVWAAVPVAVAATVWFWPGRGITRRRVETEVQP